MSFQDDQVRNSNLSDGGRLPPLQAVRNKYVSVAGVNPPSDKRSARMRRDSEKYYVG